jgi:hypothetical protein
MLDLVAVLAAAVLFAVSLFYVRGCEKLGAKAAGARR